MRYIILNRKEFVPVKELGEEWLDLAIWWPDHVSLMGRDLAGRVLVDDANLVAIIPVIKFKSSRDTVSIRTGIEWLENNGYTDLEYVNTSRMNTYPVVRTRKKRVSE